MSPYTLSRPPQDIGSAGGAGLPAPAVCQRLQEGPLLRGHRARRGAPPEPLGQGRHLIGRPDVAGRRRGGRGQPPPSANEPAGAGGHVVVGGRGKPEVHLRAAGMGGGDTGVEELKQHYAVFIFGCPTESWKCWRVGNVTPKELQHREMGVTPVI